MTLAATIALLFSSRIPVSLSAPLSFSPSLSRALNPSQSFAQWAALASAVNNERGVLVLNAALTSTTTKERSGCFRLLFLLLLL